MSPATTEKPLILLVDDMPSNLHVLVESLRDDYSLKITTSGAEALKLAETEKRPHLILLDMMMPEMSGVDVLRHLRRNPGTRDIPVIFVSADTSEQSQIDSLDLGADDYLTKPVVRAVLLARVRNLLLRKQTEAQLRLASHVFHHSGEAILITDSNNRIVEVNPSFTRLTGYSAEEVRGQDPRILRSNHHGAEFYQDMWAHLTDGGNWRGEIFNRRKGGEIHLAWLSISVVRDAADRLSHYVAIYSDISQLHDQRQQLRHQAHHDALTGLPNRTLLLDRIAQAIRLAERGRHGVALLFLDLDRFKVVNDSLGHEAGDELLREVARRISETVRASDTVARLGGDEFVVLMPDCGEPADVAQVAEKVVVALQTPFVLAGTEAHIGASIGISLYPTDGSDPHILMKQADTAMYAAKENGRNGYRFFAPVMENVATERLLLETGLHHAMERNELVVHYQPKVSLLDSRMTGMEALVRWNHPTLGLLPPDRFIPMAEETGLIIPLGEWVLAAVCRQIVAWREGGHHFGPVAINVSARQLLKPDFVERLSTIIAGEGIEPTAIELELTETTIMSDPDRAVIIFKRLSDIGVKLHLDDFGTGHSNLSYLRHLPVRTLKIDGSFIQNMLTAEGSTELISSVIQLATAFGMDVVAECVETEGQATILRAMGCSLAQGYLYSTALPADELAARYSSIKP
ncbi:MAG: EAL domain-containing protein [Alphaproteobacteria bacterium]